MTWVIVLLFPFKKIKLIRLCSDRIGHYALNTELLLCHLDEIKWIEKNVSYIFYTIDSPLCNQQLHKMWKRIIFIFPLPKIADQINNTLFFLFRDKYKNASLKMYETSYGCQDSNGFFQKYLPRLSFTDAEKQQGRQLLSNLGIKKETKFVCLFARDSAYLKKYFPGRDWSYHDYRDCSIQNFTKAALFLAEKGYVVIRMGKTVSQPFQINHPNIIDYANHNAKSDFGDIYLAAHCEFMISTSSGLDGVSQIFRKPLLFVNVAPFNRQLQYWYPCELFIVKKIFDERKQKLVTFDEINHCLAIENNPSIQLNQLNWSVIENNEDDILEVTEEMERLVNKTQFKNFYDPFCFLIEESDSFPMIANYDRVKSNLKKFYIRMGSQFIQKNPMLFSSKKSLQEV